MYDESYVLEILQAMRPGLTCEQFRAAVQRDRNAGYAAECDEAERRYFPPPLSAAMRRALEAVKSGQCQRVYAGEGNTLHGPKGVGAATLWRLDSAKLIADGPDSHGGLVISVTLVLTRAGKAALDAA